MGSEEVGERIKAGGAQATTKKPAVRTRAPERAAEQLLPRSQELRSEWALDKAASDLPARVRTLLLDIVESGTVIEDDDARASLWREISSWRRWFASTHGELVDPGLLKPFVPALAEEYQVMMPRSLLRELADGHCVYRRLIRDVNFSKIVKQDVLANAFAAGKVVDCRFEDCNFDEAHFGTEEVIAGEGANFIHVAFVDCTWNRIRWPGASASSFTFEDAKGIFEADFEGANFADVLFRSFGGRKFRFGRANFTNCKFSDADFDESDFTGATFMHCKFEHVTFAGCNLSHAALYDCDLRGTQFAGGSLNHALLAECELDGVTLIEGRPCGRPGNVLPSLENTRWETSFDVPELFEISARPDFLDQEAVQQDNPNI